MTEYYHGQDRAKLTCPVCDTEVVIVDDPIVNNERKSHYRCNSCGREFDHIVRAVGFFCPRECAQEMIARICVLCEDACRCKHIECEESCPTIIRLLKEKGYDR
jgi:predicted RNA-binding Zn-ribbon protein involved in translation (DUF1610 family)